MIRVWILFAILASWSVDAQFIRPGFCPNVPAKTNFDAARFAGVWYPIRQYPTFYETSNRCQKITYTLKNGMYSITQSQIHVVPRDITPTSWSGNGKFPKGLTVGRWNWGLPTLPFNIPSIPYQVIETDYHDYAVVFSCINLGVFHIRQLWIMTKIYPLFVAPWVVSKAKAVLPPYKLDSALLIPNVQVGCPLPPISSLLPPITLPSIKLPNIFGKK